MIYFKRKLIQSNIIFFLFFGLYILFSSCNNLRYITNNKSTFKSVTLIKVGVKNADTFFLKKNDIDKIFELIKNRKKTQIYKSPLTYNLAITNNKMKTFSILINRNIIKYGKKYYKLDCYLEDSINALILKNY